MESTESVKNQRRAVIIGAAAIGNYEKIASYLQPDRDFYMYCDGGLLHQRQLEEYCGQALSPNLIVGDFDSYQLQKGFSFSAVPCQVIQLPREKDDTDTWFAVKEALRRGFTDFLLLGWWDNDWTIAWETCLFCYIFISREYKPSCWMIFPRWKLWVTRQFSFQQISAIFPC